MKRFITVLVLLGALAFAATPALAQGTKRQDVICTGGSSLVKADDVVDSLVLFGCNARVSAGAQIRKDIVAFGGNVTVEENVSVAGTVAVFGGNFDLAGHVQRDVTMFGGIVTLSPTAVIDRDVAVIGGQVDQKEGAIVRGRITRNEAFRPGIGPVPPVPPIAPALNGNAAGNIWLGALIGFGKWLVYAIALAALGALVVVFMPKQTRQVIETSQAHAMPSVGVGCLTTFGAITLSILLIITLCGIPFSVILLFVFAIAGAFGWIALGWLAGEKILHSLKVRESWSVPVVAVIVGIFMLSVIGAVPVIGWLVGAFLGCLGLGAVVLTRFGTRTYPAPAIATSVPSTPSLPTPPPLGDQSSST